MLKRSQYKTILRQVRQVLSRGCDYADEVGVAPEQRDKIQKTLWLDGFE
jgi:hypothetical protein